MPSTPETTTSEQGLVTIKDVARRAGVSPTSVSNLLNGRDTRMSVPTRRRIQRAMDELAYRPSQIARNLRTGQAPAIGLIVPSVANPFWGDWAQHLEAEAMRHGQQVLLCNSVRDPERERRYVEELWSSGVRAIVLGSSLPSLDHLQATLHNGLTLIAFDRESQGADDPGIINLSVDNFGGGRMATDHLVALGHRRIGFISGAITTISRQRRLAGYVSALAEAGLGVADELIWAESDPTLGDTTPAATGAHGMLSLLALPDPPTAVVTINDMYAVGACSALRSVGLDTSMVSVVGFDDIVLAPLYNPPLTTIRQPLRRMAEYAIRTIQNPPRPRGTAGRGSVMMRASLVERGSTHRLETDPFETAALHRDPQAPPQPSSADRDTWL